MSKREQVLEEALRCIAQLGDRAGESVFRYGLTTWAGVGHDAVRIANEALEPK